MRRVEIEDSVKQVPCREWKTETESGTRTVCKTVCKPVTTCETRMRKKLEWVTETYTVMPCDPCETLKGSAGAKGGKIAKAIEPETRCRRVLRCSTVCESVPVTRMVREVVSEEVPYTICRKVAVCTIKEVPCKVRKVYMDECVKEVPYTTCRYECEKIVKEVPYTTVRIAKGAYVDGEGKGHKRPGSDSEGSKATAKGKMKGASKAWPFVEGSHWDESYTTCHTRIEREMLTKTVPCVTWTTQVEEKPKWSPM